VSVAGRSKRVMEVHAAAAPPEFPVTACRLVVSGRAMGIRVGKRRVRTPPADPQRIVVLGDSGCRLAAPSSFQACNDPAQWPFARVARGVAAWKPDLIVHVGDYLYREASCPDGNQGCAGSPFGDNWPAWDADFFAPAAPALKAAPWVFVRGNHESCGRGGEGWFRFLDPRPMPGACADVTKPYAVRLARMKLLMLDSSGASDFSPYNPAPYVSQFAVLGRAAAGLGSWFVTHRPLWGLASIDGGTNFAVTNPTLQQASGNALPPKAQLVLSGHLHSVEVLSFSGRRPPQVVSGGAGTQLDPQLTAPFVGADIAGRTVTDGEVLSRFGFMTLARRARRPGWKLAFRDPSGVRIVRCVIARGAATC
jgi:hypothetical protein